MLTTNRWVLVMAAAAGSVFAVPTNAAMISYVLDQTNINPTLADNIPYLRVDIDDNTANRITFTVTPLSSLTSLLPLSNFGLQEFAFNVVGTNPLLDASGSNAQWALPDDWTANVAPPPNQADGFGRFEVMLTGGGSDRVSPLTFALIGTGLTINSFAELSGNPAGEGNVFFGARVAGFDASGTTSAYFGGSTLDVVPLPAALPLLLSGLVGVGALSLRRRRHAPGSPRRG